MVYEFTDHSHRIDENVLVVDLVTTIVPSFLLIKTGKQSAVIIAQITPALDEQLASAFKGVLIVEASIHIDE